MRLRSVRTKKRFSKKRVLLRVDFNVPVKNGRVQEDWRIIKTIQTIRHLVRGGARVVILSHRGRPKGRRDASLSLAQIARHLAKLLDRRVTFSRDCVGRSAERAVSTLKSGEVLLLENVRFHSGEEKNDLKFAKALATHGDLFVNDAFAVCHRKHASVVGITKYLPSFAGLLLQDEIENLQKVLKPQHPFVVLMGGAKIKTKIGVITSLLSIADRIMIGGALAIPFLRAAGFSVGKSQVDRGDVLVAKKLLGKRKIMLPVDLIVSSGKKVLVRGPRHIGAGEIISDIGPATICHYAEEIRRAKTIVWNGPMGVFEEPAFSHGTIALGRFIATRASGRAFGVIGGGETIQAMRQTQMAQYMDWVSTGGGAMLAYLEHQKLPGLKPLIK